MKNELNNMLEMHYNKLAIPHFFAHCTTHLVLCLRFTNPCSNKKGSIDMLAAKNEKQHMSFMEHHFD